MARRVNDGVAKAVAEDPGRLHGLATLPMADPAAAAVELTHHPKALAFLVDLVGADRVVLGSDFPFDMAEWPPSRVLSAALVR